ncbi:D-alanyl-D-alanine carboxypeptidase family protein [Actinotalea ferrariae]|uniref:D-alanyl-D-alanine carboxypeptidase family protein n=1 Tax=Actinotalea ferrariae TaxID=1386098 RepID=UPI001C8B3235|nr:D-alanyl-D-alanine carboxypeptidase family protein [Actinotalea ferrariae]MBX9243335.1 D-alanyl-D-alanine carboxypeptidase family protein [Actinotalea ferrariae]
MRPPEPADARGGDLRGGRDSLQAAADDPQPAEHADERPGERPDEARRRRDRRRDDGAWIEGRQDEPDDVVEELDDDERALPGSRGARALNGRLDLASLARVRTFPGAFLRADVEASWSALRDDVQRRFGWRPTLTSAADAYRTFERQRTLFLDRYRTTPATVTVRGRVVEDRRVWDGVAYWRFRGAAAAVPGESNHGLATTVDIADLAYRTTRFDQCAAVAADHGWSNAEGESVGEAWHWSKVAAGVATPSPVALAAAVVDEEEDDMVHVIQAPSFGVALLAGGRLIGIADAASVESWNKKVPADERVQVTDADFLRMAAASTSTWLLFCPPHLGGRGFAVWSGGRAVALGDQAVVDQIAARGVPTLTVGAADFDRFVS